jgi:hypothetical protein
MSTLTPPGTLAEGCSSSSTLFHHHRGPELLPALAGYSCPPRTHRHVQRGERQHVFACSPGQLHAVVVVFPFVVRFLHCCSSSKPHMRACCQRAELPAATRLTYRCMQANPRVMRGTCAALLAAFGSCCLGVKAVLQRRAAAEVRLAVPVQPPAIAY